MFGGLCSLNKSSGGIADSIHYRQYMPKDCDGVPKLTNIRYDPEYFKTYIQNPSINENLIRNECRCPG